MTNFDLDDLLDLVSEHKLSLLLVGCLAVAGFNLATGGKDKLAQKWEQDEKQTQKQEQLTQVANNQEVAYQTFVKSGCTAQAISRRSKTNNFTSGDVAVDPSSVTPDNPDGSPISGGFICSNDGSIYSADETGMLTKIGTSPKIRQALVEKGFKDSTTKMLRGSFLSK